MSVSVARPTPIAPSSLGSRRVSTALIAYAGLACIMVVGSGLVRNWQVARVEGVMRIGRESPFPLKTLPMTVGSWAGTVTELDPRIVEATGSTDHITRRYVDQKTGVALDVIVLYGPTSDVFIHSPELCYPKAGFLQKDGAIDRKIDPDGVAAPFRSLVYRRGGDSSPGDLQEVFYSWRYNGHWSISTGTQKESERIPGMYKVQIARRVSPSESRTLGNPCEAFLEVLIPDLEARIKGQPEPPASAEPKA